MFWLFIVVVLILFAVTLWVLAVPIRIECDSEKQTCNIHQRGTFSATAVIHNTIEVKVMVFGITVKPSGKSKKKKPRRKRSKNKAWPKGKGSKLRLFRRCLKSLSLQRLNISLDTGDVVLNAQLVPLAYLMTNLGKNRFVNINFEGHVLVQLEAELRLYVILIAFMKHLLKR